MATPWGACSSTLSVMPSAELAEVTGQWGYLIAYGPGPWRPRR